ncbi:MAG: hypothetical protein R6U40_06845 [Desulfobacterales bacterium]
MSTNNNVCEACGADEIPSAMKQCPQCGGELAKEKPAGIFTQKVGLKEVIIAVAVIIFFGVGFKYTGAFFFGAWIALCIYMLAKKLSLIISIGGSFLLAVLLVIATIPFQDGVVSLPSTSSIKSFLPGFMDKRPQMKSIYEIVNMSDAERDSYWKDFRSKECAWVAREYKRNPGFMLSVELSKCKDEGYLK